MNTPATAVTALSIERETNLPAIRRVCPQGMVTLPLRTAFALTLVVIATTLDTLAMFALAVATPLPSAVPL